jgi:hypothetical protein
MFTLRPTTPPPHCPQRPPLSNRSKHEPVLGATATETVCGELTKSCRNPRIFGELRNPELNSIGSGGHTSLKLCMLAECREDIVIRLQITPVLFTETVKPHSHVMVQIDVRQLTLRIDLILIPFIDLSFPSEHFISNCAPYLAADLRVHHWHAFANPFSQQDEQASRGF